MVHFWFPLLKRDTQPTLRHHDSRPPRFHAYRIPKFFFSSLPSTPLRMTKVEKFLSLSVLNSWFSHLTSHLSPLISSTLRFYDFTTSRFYDFTISPIHDSLIHNLQFHKFTIHNSLLTLSSATNKKLSSGYQRVIY